jgi:hypothetical protein
MTKSFSGETPTPNEAKEPLQADPGDAVAMTTADRHPLKGRFKVGPVILPLQVPLQVPPERLKARAASKCHPFVRA